jgi:ATP-dependent RNA helicase TDRD9
MLYLLFSFKKGPYSPLEVSYYSIVNVGSRKKVRPERESINFVTIDDDPCTDCDRLMIASDISLNALGDTILLRKTCLMPKLRGLTSLCCLLYSPTIELRLDQNGKSESFTGALCGLGFDEKNASIHPENDVEISFDVEIDGRDITMVCIRYKCVNFFFDF